VAYFKASHRHFPKGLKRITKFYHKSWNGKRDSNLVLFSSEKQKSIGIVYGTQFLLLKIFCKL